MPPASRGVWIGVARAIGSRRCACSPRKRSSTGRAGVGGLAAMRRRAGPTVSADSAARDAAAAAVQPEEEQPWLQRVGEPPNLDPHFPS